MQVARVCNSEYREAVLSGIAHGLAWACWLGAALVGICFWLGFRQFLRLAGM